MSSLRTNLTIGYIKHLYKLNVFLKGKKIQNPKSKMARCFQEMFPRQHKEYIQIMLELENIVPFYPVVIIWKHRLIFLLVYVKDKFPRNARVI